MEENRLEGFEEQEEIVLTYRPAEQQEVVLRYEGELPPCMRPAEAPGAAKPPAWEQESPWRSAIAPPERKKKGRWGVRVFVGASLLIALICLGVGIWYVGQNGWTLPGGGGENRPGHRDDGTPPPPSRDGEDSYYWDSELSDEEITIPSYPAGGTVRLSLVNTEGLPVLTPEEIYNRVAPSTVTVLGVQTSMYGSVGTGIIFSEDGYILTNCHVIAGCRSCSVLITGEYGVNEEYDAKVVGYDVDRDLAVLKISGRDLPAAEFGVSDELRMGEPAYAIGNPLGMELHNTMTSGSISAINRDVDVDGVVMTLIQTDAALNSGNSGGPLINQYGQVIGVNTIKMMSEYDTIEGLGFAIPSSLALRWVNELIQFGQLQPQPVLGVTIDRIPDTLPDGTPALRIESVTPGLSGDAAGLQAGDYLVSFNGQSVSSTEQVLAIRRDLYVGDEVPLRIYRGREYLDLVMTMMAES